jgi:FkbM family methyltransferase
VAVIKDVFWHRVYSPPGFAIADGAIVVDVGAHIGAFAAQAARAAKGVVVLAFEPHPENFDLLTGNLARNGITNVRAQNCGIAGAKGSRALHVSANPAGHSLHIVEAGGSGIMPVPTVTLADVLATHSLPAIDLLKMDCEGAEYEILEAAVHEALPRVRRIAMEAHRLDGARTPERLVSLLESQGFCVRTQSKDDATAMVWAQRVQAV